MNEFLETKLGEVLAFARIGTDTLEKGKAGYEKILSEDDIKKLSASFNGLEEKVTSLIAKENVTEQVEEHAKETQDKVTDMRDTYIDGEWDESDEVLEWMGFYSGASLVHWYLVNGAAESLSLSELRDISTEAITVYRSLFSADEKFLHAIGAKGVSKQQ